MNSLQQAQTNRVRVMWLAVALALLAALSYRLASFTSSASVIRTTE